MVPRARNFDWDYLIWVLYNSKYEIEEAWLWDVASYQSELDLSKKVRPGDMRQGSRISLDAPQ